MSLPFQKSKSDRVVDVFLYILLTLFALSTLFPLYYVVVMSITPLDEVLRQGGFVTIPGSITLEAYKQIFSSARVPRAMGVTIFISTVGTFLNLVVTTLIAYPLSKKHIPGRNVILFGIVFTMLFAGGMIPTYLVVRAVGLLNSIWALIIPGLVSAFNLLIMKSYFENLPSEIEDAAKVDGCGDVRTLVQIVLPLSKPIMATMALFYGVHHWNTYFHAIMFITDESLHPIQVVLRRMIQNPSVRAELEIQSMDAMQNLPPETVKMATIVVAIVPIIMIYPFLQKYFIKGIMLGSIKG